MSKIQQILLAVFVFAGCSGEGKQVNSSGAMSPDSPDSGGGATINLTPGQPLPEGLCPCPCPDGTTGTKACVQTKIFKAMPNKASFNDIVTPDGCTCPSPKPDGGVPSPDTMIATQPDATLVPDATEPPPPPVMADAATVPPTPPTPDAGLPQFPTSLVDAPISQPDTGPIFPTSLPRPDVAPPQVTVTPDAMIVPDAATPDTRIVPDLAPDTRVQTPDAAPPVIVPDTAPPVTSPDTAPDTFVPPPVVIPDALPDMQPDLQPDLHPDLQPDLQPDLGRDTTPDLELPVDTYVAPDLQPALGPDTKPDCGCTEKRDTAPACWHKTAWIGNITLTLQECGGVKVEWKPEDCSSNGFKVVWIKYSVDDEGNVDLPSYPDHADGYQYVGNVTTYTIEGLSSGKWTVRVYKYPTGGGGTEGMYSAPEFVIVP